MPPAETGADLRADIVARPCGRRGTLSTMPFGRHIGCSFGLRRKMAGVDIFVHKYAYKNQMNLSGTKIDPLCDEKGKC